MMRTLAYLLLPTLVFASACKGESDDPLTQCVNLEACGGELEGTFTVETLCYPDGEPSIPPDDMCPEQTAELLSSDASGSITFESDGTYSSDLTTTIRYELTTPLSCLGGMEAGCQAAEALLLAAGLSGGCSVEGENCVCDLSATGGGQDVGTFQTSGNAVTMTSAGGEVSTGEYCVEGGRLGYLTEDTDDEGNTIKTNIVLTRN